MANGDDLRLMKQTITGMVEELLAGPKSRERALAITKPQEARFWLHEDLSQQEIKMWADQNRPATEV